MKFLFAFPGPIITIIAALNESYAAAIIILAVELAWVAWEVAGVIEKQQAMAVAGDEAFRDLREKYDRLEGRLEDN